MKIPKLSPAQKRLLSDAKDSPGLVVDGRRMAAAYALEKAGLVKTETWIVGVVSSRWQVKVTPISH